MIFSSVRLILAAGHEKDATDILTRYRERTRFLDGCRSCRLYYDASETKSLMVEEVWSDEGALNRHLASASYQEVLLVMEMASSMPEIRFIPFSEFSGFDRIERAREGISPPD
ncbi:MAG TPA: antibiotic biosynthesis monooxygenase [Thermodesulfobacteriota bacterium]|nr:antibiotic biosynthesis monooxygenase [Thermodesulfobacteriota bacterium]